MAPLGPQEKAERAQREVQERLQRLARLGSPAKEAPAQALGANRRRVWEEQWGKCGQPAASLTSLCY
jgi:hypothetical protein